APSPPQTLAAQLVAQGRRFKPDQLLAGAARAADVVEVETLRMLLLGKSSGWEVLTLVAETDPRLDRGLLATLRARGDDQIERITELHRALAAERLLRAAR
ncbi:hypothetical protein, partial [Nocardioides sp. R-C-SC26]|uniref:hypothetical protein n=1 Tax=Nocardioides sp. R-C-SC26 TaxID=2870414 RepID=UPI001E64A37D